MKKNDWILIAAFLVAAVIIYMGIKFFVSGNGAYVIVKKDGEILATLPLDEDTEYVIGDDEEYNVLVIKNGEATITDASCPGKSCVHQKTISSSGSSLICVPNRVIVQVVSDDKSESEYDAISY